MQQIIRIIGISTGAVAGPNAGVNVIIATTPTFDPTTTLRFEFGNLLALGEYITQVLSVSFASSQLLSDDDNPLSVVQVSLPTPPTNWQLFCYVTTNYDRTINLIVGRSALAIEIFPTTANIPAGAPGGAVVASLTGVWANGRPFQGNFTFVANPDNIFAITQDKLGDVGYLIVNPDGPGVGMGGSLEGVLVVANDPPV